MRCSPPCGARSMACPRRARLATPPRRSTSRAKVFEPAHCAAWSTWQVRWAGIGEMYQKKKKERLGVKGLVKGAAKGSAKAMVAGSLMAAKGSVNAAKGSAKLAVGSAKLTAAVAKGSAKVVSP